MRCSRLLVVFCILFPGAVSALSIHPAPDANNYVPADTVKVIHQVSKAVPSSVYYKLEVIDESDNSVYYSVSGSPYLSMWKNRRHVRFFPYSQYFTDDLQAQAVPLKPGTTNTIRISKRTNMPWFTVASYTGLRINPSYRVLPVRLHLLTLDATNPDEDWDPTLNQTSNPFWQYPLVFMRWFDTYDWPHCDSSGNCAVSAYLPIIVINDCQSDDDCDPGYSCISEYNGSCIRKSCTTDLDCPDGWACDSIQSIDYDETYSRRRVCWPSSQCETWSADMAFSPGAYLPTAAPSSYPYTNCQTLFRVEDGDFTNSYSYNNVIDVITFDDNWKDVFNCGALQLRAEAVLRAKNKGTLSGDDGMIHVFLTRSIAESPSACNTANGCPISGISGISDSIIYGTGLPHMPIVFVALESACNPIVGSARFPMVAAHEIGHEGGLPHDVSGASPTYGSLMDGTWAQTIPSQNYHLFRHTTSPVYNQCTTWRSTMNSDYDSAPVNLNQ